MTKSVTLAGLLFTALAFVLGECDGGSLPIDGSSDAPGSGVSASSETGESSASSETSGSSSPSDVDPVGSMLEEGWFGFQSPAPVTLGYLGIVDAEIDGGILKTKVGIAHMYDSMLEDLLEHFEIDPNVPGFGLLKTYHLADGRKLNVDFLLVEDFLDASYNLEHASWPEEGALDISMARFPKPIEDETDLSKVDETLTAVEYSFAYSSEENSSYLVDIDDGSGYLFEQVLTSDNVALEVSIDGFWSIVE